ncbi:hypothetical protein IQ07DRAFT_58038 [Pyrenochaeta sp. DS3sAY3a]|nr:hypothetical protein IQ07DRAFT_58038 [Pyrenochaeta sp. DS3sAY3a]
MMTTTDPNLPGLATQTPPSITQIIQMAQTSTAHLSSSCASGQNTPNVITIPPAQFQAHISSPRLTGNSSPPLHTQTAGTPSTVPNIPPPQPPDEFRDPVLLKCTTRPGTNHYPYARLSLEHEERAPQLKGILLDAVIQSKAYLRVGLRKLFLRDCRGQISFREAMCGTSPATASPSIIITSPEKICSMLKTEFSTEGTRYQYASGRTPGPAFDLYFCPSNFVYHRRWSTVQTTVEPVGSEEAEEPDTVVGTLTMCGARIDATEDGGRNATSSGTVSCVLHIKGAPHLLAPAHPFCGLDLEEDSLEELLFADDGADNEIFYAEEDDNSMLNNMEYNGKNTSVPSEPGVDTEAGDCSPEFEVDNSRMIIPGVSDLGSDDRDCDWAVRPITEASERLPNAYLPNPTTFALRHITEIANGFSREEHADNRVHILTSTGVKEGTLLPGRAMICGLSGRGFCDALVVSMEENADIVDGDSGALVVDATSAHAYGHLVATSPDGDAYVVPLRDTIGQIKSFFATTDVRLPDPLWSLTGTALLYLENKQVHLAQRSIVALGNLVSQVCDARKWQRLAHWVEACAARSTILNMSSERFKGNYYDRVEDVETLRAPLTAQYILQRLVRSEAISPESGLCPQNISKDVHDSLMSLAKHVLLEPTQEQRCLTRTHDETWLDISSTTSRHGRINWKEPRCSSHQRLLSWLDILSPHPAQKIPKTTSVPLLTFSGTKAGHRLCCSASSCSPLARRGRILQESMSITHCDWILQEFVYTPLSWPWAGCSGAELQPDLPTQRDTGLLSGTQLFVSQEYLSDPLEEALASQSCRGEQLSSGGFATVYRFTLPGIVRRKGAKTGTTQFAVKIISRKTTPYSLWATEKQILERLTKSNNPHIIELVASRCTSEDYRLLLPLAQCTMDDLMESDPLPSQKLSLWMARQFHGLAGALESMHNMTSGDCVRHGDLKPSNILWFSDDTPGSWGGLERDPTAGSLVIADFGLARFHKLGSRKRRLEREQSFNVDPQNGHNSLVDRRYAAPEIEISSATYSDPRAYDIWSFGCVMLEFLVWYLHGVEGRRRLRRSLRSIGPSHSASFWHIDMATQSLAFSLQNQVSERLQMLQESKQENSELQGTIDLILYGGLLDPDPDLRPTARQLGKMFSRIVSGPSNEYLHRSSPIWTRSWTLQLHLPYLSLRAPPEPANPNELAMINKDDEVPADVEELEPQACDTDTSDSLDSSRETSIKQRCPYCSQEGRPVALKYHIRALHRNKKPAECPLCGYLYMDQKHCAVHCEGCGYPMLMGQLRSTHTTNVFDRDIRPSSQFQAFFDHHPSPSSPRHLKRKFEEEEEDHEENTDSETYPSTRAKATRARFPQMRCGIVKRNPDDDFQGGGACLT